MWNWSPWFVLVLMASTRSWSLRMRSPQASHSSPWEIPPQKRVMLSWGSSPATSLRRTTRRTASRSNARAQSSCRPGASLHVPDVEALDVELKPLVGLGADALHEQLIGANGFLAHVAVFPIRGTAPEAWDMVVRELTRCELAEGH